MSRRTYSLLAAALAALLATPALGEDAPVRLVLKDHKFAPREADAPAGKAFVIEVENQDTTASEFESKELRVEKIVPAGGTAKMKVRALGPGRYRFFDDYHEDTTDGFVVVK